MRLSGRYFPEDTRLARIELHGRYVDDSTTALATTQGDERFLPAPLTVIQSFLREPSGPRRATSPTLRIVSRNGSATATCTAISSLPRIPVVTASCVKACLLATGPCRRIRRSQPIQRASAPRTGPASRFTRTGTSDEPSRCTHRGTSTHRARCIGPTNNLRLRMSMTTDMRAVHLVDGAGHWVQQEQAEATSHLLLEFLGGLG